MSSGGAPPSRFDRAAMAATAPELRTSVNPLAGGVLYPAAGAAGAPQPPPALVVHLPPSAGHTARISALAAKVAAARAARLSLFEYALKGLSALMTLPFLGLTGFTVVPANSAVAIFRFGKLDGVIRRPGVTWITPGFDRVQTFTGTATHRLDELNVVDAAGNPIIVRALLEYAVEDPAALHIATNDSLTVLYNQAEQVVRAVCAQLPLLGDHGRDIRSQPAALSDAMVAELQPDATVFGVVVQRLVIIEARYAPEIASQMLMKQQAAAMVSARKEIVTGALSIVGDVLAEFPGLTIPSRERLITNMLITLSSQTHAQTVVPLDAAT
jgi:hypothetical protein